MRSIPPPDGPLPASYQQTDAAYVFNALHAGESCALIGVGSVGKSNLLRHLMRPDVKALHLAEAAPYVMTVLLDPHTLMLLRAQAAERVGDLWMGYELMLSRLYRVVRDIPVLYEAGEPGQMSIAQRIKAAHNELYNSDPVIAQRGLRHLENAIYNILRQDDRYRIAFFFDEIEEFMRLPAEFFLTLRGIRDDHKGRLAFVTTSRSDLVDVMVKPFETRHRETIEGFVELFHEHTRYINPLDPASARAALNRFVNRYNDRDKLNDRQIAYLTEELLKLTGGHVGLLRRSYKPTIDYYFYAQQAQGMTLAEYLITNSGVQKECQTLIDSLTLEERAAFSEIINHSVDIDPVIAGRLMDKCVIEQTGAGYRCRYALLHRYLSTRPGAL